MEGFFGKKSHSTYSNFKGGNFHFSNGYSVSNLIVNIAQQNCQWEIVLEGERERERERTKWRYFSEKNTIRQSPTSTEEFSLFTRMQCVLTNSKYSSPNSSEENEFRGRDRVRTKRKYFSENNKIRQTPSSDEEFFTFHTDAVCLT